MLMQADEPDEMAELLPVEGLNFIDHDFTSPPMTSDPEVLTKH